MIYATLHILPLFYKLLHTLHMENLWPFMVYQIVLYYISDVCNLIQKNQNQAY